MSKKPIAFRHKKTGEFSTGGFLLYDGWEKEWVKLYDHPQEWQRLTDEEIIKMSDDAYEMIELIKGKTLIFDRHKFAKAIEQKLKEKNHGTT